MTAQRFYCGSCGGDGLYSGLAEPAGTAVICHDCKGEGALLEGHPKATKEVFAGRKLATGIRMVRAHGGLFAKTGPTNISITYAEFCAGKMPGN